MDIVRKHTYVGMADETHALLQHGTRLYLLNVSNLSRDMFYQQVCAAAVICMCLPCQASKGALLQQQHHMQCTATQNPACAGC